MSSEKIKVDVDKFNELMSNMELKNIFTLKMDFSLMPNCLLSQPYTVTIGRAPSNLIITETELYVIISFELNGNAEDKPFFTSHFDFQIVYEHTNREHVENLANLENVKDFFIGYQSDKIVWPYLRQAFHRTLLDGGIKPVTLPLYR